MKIKDLLNISKNNSNNQSNWNPKKRKIKELGLTEEDILNIKISRDLKKCLE